MTPVLRTCPSQGIHSIKTNHAASIIALTCVVRLEENLITKELMSLDNIYEHILQLCFAFVGLDINDVIIVYNV